MVGQAAADHRAARLRGAGGIGAGRRGHEPRRRRGAARARRSAARVRAARGGAGPRAGARRGARPPAGVADVLVKREAAGDAAGFDRLRAEREVLDLDADRATAATDRARAQAALAGFFADAVDPAAPRRRGRAAGAGGAARRWTRWSSGRSPCAASCRRCARKSKRRGFSARAADRRRDSGARDRRRTKSSSLGGGDLGSVFAVQASIPLFDRGRTGTCAGRRRAPARPRRAPRRSGWRCAAQIAALRAAVDRTPRRRRALPRERP